jgi:hypothetical protein
LPEEITNPRVVQAFHATALDNNLDTRSELYAALLESTLLVPLVEAANRTTGIQVTLADGRQAQLVTGRTDKGDPVLPAFTDEASHRAWRPAGGQCVALPALQLFSIALQHNMSMVVVNPWPRALPR